jgi:hypothetical protein
MLASPRPPHVPHVPLKKEEQEVRRRHDLPAPQPKHHDPEEEGVLGEKERPAPPSEKPR